MIALKTNQWEINDVEAVFFDKDGTLIDSHIYWGRIIEKRSEALIKKYNLPISYFETLCMIMGFSFKERKLLPEGPIALVSREEVIRILCNYFIKNNIRVVEQEISELFVEVHSEFVKEIYDYIKILPQVKELLKILQKKQIKTAVITTDSIKNTEEIMKYLGLNEYFDILIGKETTPQPKISGVPALISVELLGVKPENTICIGDAPMDIIMSKKANLKAGIGVALGQTTIDELSKHTSYVIKNYGELEIV